MEYGDKKIKIYQISKKRCIINYTHAQNSSWFRQIKKITSEIMAKKVYKRNPISTIQKENMGEWPCKWS